MNDPPASGPDEVQVRVLSLPVHPGDLLGVAGRYRAPGDTAAVPIGGVRVGFDGMGTIAAVGSAVEAAVAEAVRHAGRPGKRGAVLLTSFDDTASTQARA